MERISEPSSKNGSHCLWGERFRGKSEKERKVGKFSPGPGPTRRNQRQLKMCRSWRKSTLRNCLARPGCPNGAPSYRQRAHSRGGRRRRRRRARGGVALAQALVERGDDPREVLQGLGPGAGEALGELRGPTLALPSFTTNPSTSPIS